MLNDHNTHTESTLIIVICHGNPPSQRIIKVKEPKKIKDDPLSVGALNTPFNYKVCVCVLVLSKKRRKKRSQMVEKIINYEDRG